MESITNRLDQIWDNIMDWRQGWGLITIREREEGKGVGGGRETEKGRKRKSNYYRNFQDHRPWLRDQTYELWLVEGAET
jgi:hypothetical protein